VINIAGTPWGGMALVAEGKARNPFTFITRLGARKKQQTNSCYVLLRAPKARSPSGLEKTVVVLKTATSGFRGLGLSADSLPPLYLETADRLRRH